MKMTVLFNGKAEEREVDSIEKGKDGLPALLMPRLRKDEMVAHTVAGEVIIINLKAAARTSRYEPAKPWDRLA